MPTKTYDLCVAVRSYTNFNGDKRNVYENIGAEFSADDGSFYYRLKPYINYAALPLSDSGDIIVRKFPAKKKQDRQNNDYSSPDNFSNSDSYGTPDNYSNQPKPQNIPF